MRFSCHRPRCSVQVWATCSKLSLIPCQQPQDMVMRYILVRFHRLWGVLCINVPFRVDSPFRSRSAGLSEPSFPSPLLPLANGRGVESFESKASEKCQNKPHDQVFKRLNFPKKASVWGGSRIYFYYLFTLFSLLSFLSLSRFLSSSLPPPPLFISLPLSHQCCWSNEYCGFHHTAPPPPREGRPHLGWSHKSLIALGVSCFVFGGPGRMFGMVAQISDSPQSGVLCVWETWYNFAANARCPASNMG